MKRRSMIYVCMAVVMAAGAFLSIPVSADSMQQGNNTIQISEAVKTLWAENGISVSDVQKALNRDSSAFIQDYGIHVYCTNISAPPVNATVNVYYNPTKITTTGFVPVASVTNFSETDQSFWKHQEIDLSITSTGRVLSYKASRSDPAYDIDNANTISMSFTHNANVSITKVGDDPSLHADMYSWHWIPLGDVNADGSVDISDFMALSSFLVESYSGPFYAVRADVNLDGSVDTTDLSLILQYINKYISHIWGNT